MQKTEAEARQCWCPMFRTACIASECMAWRWGEAGAGSKSKIEAIRDRREATGEGLHEAKRWAEGHPWEWAQPTRGYCGLAGKP